MVYNENEALSIPRIALTLMREASADECSKRGQPSISVPSCAQSAWIAHGMIGQTENNGQVI